MIMSPIWIVMAVATALDSSLSILSTPMKAFRKQKQAIEFASIESMPKEITVGEHQYIQAVSIIESKVDKLVKECYVVWTTALFQSGDVACKVIGTYRTKQAAEMNMINIKSGDMEINNKKANVVVGCRMIKISI